MEGVVGGNLENAFSGTSFFILTVIQKCTNCPFITTGKWWICLNYVFQNRYIFIFKNNSHVFLYKWFMTNFKSL